MLVFASDWATISSLATAGGTLVLALATFMSVRSANRSARVAEVALQEQRRPLLAPSRLEDPVQKMIFVDGHWVRAAGGRGVAEQVDGTVYLAMSIRNVGSGVGVCQGWAVFPGVLLSATAHAAEEDFRRQSRDLYVAGGDLGMWQGALRNPEDPVRAQIVEQIEKQEPISLELLYSDLVGRQRTITRFGLIPAADSWLVSMTRHWYLDWDGPRPENELRSASEAALHDMEAAGIQLMAQRAQLPRSRADGAPARDGGERESERGEGAEPPGAGAGRGVNR